MNAREVMQLAVNDATKICENTEKWNGIGRAIATGMVAQKLYEDYKIGISSQELIDGIKE